MMEMVIANAKTILVIEDDPNTANLIVLYLEREGFATLHANDGKTGLDLATTRKPALVILDLMLPQMDGWEVCRRLRRLSDVPIIMLTARGEEVDRVSGLTLGADDYVVKPFSPRELVARVQAVLRRMAPQPEHGASVLVCGSLTLDMGKRRLTIDGQVVPLTPHEYALLKTLMTAPGRTFTREELLDRIYPQGEAVVIERVVDVHIGKLRRKIEPVPAVPRYILTVRGLGYGFTDAPASETEI
jgi:DNA-binding response OmpR family regulator